MMGADDYVDAHERLTKLRLKKGQQPDVVRVLLECCGQEGVFNRFYALLAARLCSSHREIKFTLHYSFWDEFKALPELTLHRGEEWRGVECFKLETLLYDCYVIAM